MWRDVDKLRTIADQLLDGGIIDAADYEATFETVLNLAVQWGHIPENEARAHRNASAVSSTEQRRIVREYVDFAETTNDPAKRSAKIRSLGVCGLNGPGKGNGKSRCRCSGTWVSPSWSP